MKGIFALAADYCPKEEDTVSFFQIIQNKLPVAATGKTAPELIRERADSTAPDSLVSVRATYRDIRIEQAC